MGVIKAGQTGTLAIHSSRSSPLPPPLLQHAQSHQQLYRAHSQGPEQSALLAGAASTQRQPAAEAKAAARHRRSQADTAYQEQQLESRVASVSFADPAAAPGATDSRADSDDQAEPPAQDAAAASLEAELPEESAWLQEMARERERNAVPWLRAAAADETPVSQRFRPVSELSDCTTCSVIMQLLSVMLRCMSEAVQSRGVLHELSHTAHWVPLLDAAGRRLVKSIHVGSSAVQHVGNQPHGYSAQCQRHLARRHGQPHRLSTLAARHLTRQRSEGASPEEIKGLGCTVPP